MSRVRFFDSSGHEVSLDRVKYTISDSLSMDTSGSLKRGITIEVNSWMKRKEVKNFLAWSNKGQYGVLQRNIVGTIQFIDIDDNIYMTARNVYIISISEESETWREWGQIKIVFSNDNMHTDDYVVLKFVGNNGSVDIYNANLNIFPSVIRKNITQIPNWNGSFYQETGYEITRIQLSGIIPWDSCDFPERIVSCFECLKLENNVLIPVEGKITDFLPDLKGIYIDNVFVESASLVWTIEKKTIQVNVSFVAPHQDIKE